MSVGIPLIYLDSDIFAGTEQHVLDLARGLRAAGQRAAIACPAQTPLADQIHAQGLEHLRIEKRGMVDPTAIRHLSRLLRRGQVDLIHAHNGRTALNAVLARSLVRRGTVVLTQHFIEPTRTTRTGLRRLVSGLAHGWMSRRLDHTVAISTAVREAILQRGECPPERVTVVPNGIADPRPEPRATPGEVRADLGVPEDAPLIVCAARLQPEKEVASLVTAMAQVVDREPRAQCVIAGQGVEQAALARQITRLGLDGRVHLLGFRSDVRAIMAAGDLFVLPAPAEGFGLVLIEAMAFAKPVVAVRAGGPLDIVEHDRTGLLVPSADPFALARTITALLGNPALRRRMGHAGRQRFERHFTAERMAQATAAVYEKALRSDDLRSCETHGREAVGFLKSDPLPPTSDR